MRLFLGNGRNACTPLEALCVSMGGCHTLPKPYGCIANVSTLQGVLTVPAFQSPMDLNYTRCRRWISHGPSICAADRGHNPYVQVSRHGGSDTLELGQDTSCCLRLLPPYLTLGRSLYSETIPIVGALKRSSLICVWIRAAIGSASLSYRRSVQCCLWVLGGSAQERFSERFCACGSSETSSSTSVVFIEQNHASTPEA